MATDTSLILITKQNCQKCDWVKSKIPDDADLRLLDAKSVDGMAILAYFEALSLKVPLLIDPRTETVIEGAINIKNAILGNAQGGNEGGKTL